MRRPRLSLEITGEVVLLAVVGGFFVYFFIQSLRWPLGTALMPRVAVLIGIPFLIARVIALARRTVEQREGIGIMDTGFRLGADPEREAKNFARICTFIVGLYLAIWIFGFHFALPVGMFLYLFFVGQMGWLRSAAVSLCFLALIVGVYDNVLHVSWHEPLIAKLW